MKKLQALAFALLFGLTMGGAAMADDSQRASASNFFNEIISSIFGGPTTQGTGDSDCADQDDQHYRCSTDKV